DGQVDAFDGVLPVGAARQADRQVGDFQYVRHGAHTRFMRRGSSVSRRPSPMMFTARTAIESMTPGKKMIHGASRKKPRPSAMTLPQVGISGGTPAPRKL